MKRILVILPKSIAGGLIMESLASGFEAIKCRVLVKAIDKVEESDLKYFRPDVVLGYDVSFLNDENCKKKVLDYGCENLVFYFADEPKSKFALGENKKLFKDFCDLKSHIFIWDRDFLHEFPKNFNGKCHFLPLAASPIRYAVEFVGYRYDISFVGRPLTEKRQKILCDLVKVFGDKLSLFCYEKHFLQSLDEIREKNLLNSEDFYTYSNCWKGFIKEENALAEIYNSSKININITEQGKSSLNYRVFEVLASGGFLLTDERADLGRYFEISKMLETYKNSEDMLDKIDFYLQNLNLAQRIAQLGRLECYENHNFVKKKKKILEKIK